MLVKEPGTRERTVWHQDLGYFNVEGEQLCTTWVPLDPVTAATGAMRFARGSHTWDRSFRPNFFVTDDPIPGTEGEAVPDVDAARGAGRRRAPLLRPRTRRPHGAPRPDAPRRGREHVAVDATPGGERAVLRRRRPVPPPGRDATEGPPRRPARRRRARWSGSPMVWRDVTPARRSRPNIVLILADDMGYGDFGFCNDGRSETPAIDHLASGGHLPRAALLGVARVRAGAGVDPDRPLPAPHRRDRHPRRAGPRPHRPRRAHDRRSPRRGRLRDRSGGEVAQRCARSRASTRPGVASTSSPASSAAGSATGTGRSSATATPDGRPTVATSPTCSPTRPWSSSGVIATSRSSSTSPTARRTSRSRRPTPTSTAFVDPDRFTNAVSRVYAMVRAMDRGVAVVLDALDRLGLAENTLVLFSSDNGPQMTGDGDESTVRFNCQYRGAKGLVSEGGIRLPMILRWPAGLPGPHRDRRPRPLHRLAPDAPRRRGGGAAARRPAARRRRRAAAPARRADGGATRSASGSGTATRRSGRATPRCATVGGSSCVRRSRRRWRSRPATS